MLQGLMMYTHTHTHTHTQQARCLCGRGPQSLRAYLFAIQRVEPLHRARVQLDGVGDVGEHLLKGVRRFLVEQDAHRLARLGAAADHRHQLGPDEVLGLAVQRHQGRELLVALQRASAQRRQGAGRGRLAHRPAGVDVLGVVQAAVGFVGGAHVALTWRRKRRE